MSEIGGFWVKLETLTGTSFVTVLPCGVVVRFGLWVEVADVVSGWADLSDSG